MSLTTRGELTGRRNPRSNPIVQEYVLPDFSAKSTSRTGYIRSGPNARPPPEGEKGEETKRKGPDEEEQVLWMGNERFAGPELLFSPSDIGRSWSVVDLTLAGINQTGLPETIAYVISQMPQELQGMFWAHIGIVGGLGNIEALGERL